MSIVHGDDSTPAPAEAPSSPTADQDAQDHADVTYRFVPHVVASADLQVLANLRSRFATLAHHVIDHVPAGPLRKEIINDLDTASMKAVAAVARGVL